MKKLLKNLFIILITLIMFLFNFSLVFSASDNVELVSEAAILMDNKTGKILYNKNENKKMYPASTTKIVTAILTLENCNLDDIVTVSYDSVMSIPDGYSSAYLQIDEQLTIEQLLQLLLVHSANDAANVLAEYVGGSVESFVSMMNTKVNELGLTNTHFTNTFGKHDENHYTTASDLALIMKYCIKNENFIRIAGSASCAIPATNKYGPRKYNSTNELIIPNSSYYYKYLTVGKTGFTTQAGDCLVSCAYKDNLELICVVLGGKIINDVSTRFTETKTLYEYGYSNYSEKSILKQSDIVTQIEVSKATKDTKDLDLLASKNIIALVNNSDSFDNIKPEIVLNENISAPIEEGEILGTATYSIDGLTYTTNLLASHHVEKSKFLKISLEIVVAIIVLILLYKIFFSRKESKI